MPTTLLAIAVSSLAIQDVPSGSREEDAWREGHSHIGDAFDEGPRQRAYLMEKPASVHFPITSGSPLAQDFFDQGIGQLHGFWYFEAERSFRQVAALEPGCAIAYWGMAMANVENDERATDFVREAWKRREGASVREQLYIEALARFHGVDSDTEPVDDEGEPVDERALRYVEDLEEIVYRYPEDIEAKAFLVNRIWYDERWGLEIVSRQANQALIDQILAVQPMHPAHHFRIHLWDGEETAYRAIDSAAKCGPSWPSCAHMWHMSGHIWSSLGRHSDAAWAQEASARVDHAHMMRDRVLPDRIHNFAHNNEWLARSLRDCGRVREAIDLALNMIELPRHPDYNTLEKRGCSATWGRLRLLGTLELFEAWDRVLELAMSPHLEPCEALDAEEQRLFVLGEACAWTGDHAGVDQHAVALEVLLAGAREERMEDAEDAEAEALAEHKSEDEVHEAMKTALRSHADIIRSLESSIAGLRALDALVSGGGDAATLETLAASSIPREHLARLHLEKGQPEDAERIAREAVGEGGSAYSLANLAYVLERAGKREEAEEAFEELREVSARCEIDHPVFERLAPLVEALGCAADWRPPEAISEDVGERMDLARLGPSRWSPSPAPAWELSGPEGRRIALRDYAGRPVVVVFFLGFGCIHCVEQLAGLGPRAAEFERAGLSLVAIGTDALDAPVAIGFPLLADPELQVFRSYRAYDDFEDMPLHGTFLVDAAGLVRWEDVSFEPFTDVDFLLEESRRLLALPVASPRPTNSAAGGSSAR